ncbi:MAG: SUMF1/EgtB/PvdO family nonheme iron enzyme [Acidimicrobiales bacterium]
MHPVAEPIPAVGSGRGQHDIEQCQIPAGTFLMGDSSGDGNRPDGELPVHEVEVASYQIDATAVTNEAFRRFVDTTGYVTEAEQFGYSAVFHQDVGVEESEITGRSAVSAVVAGSPWRAGTVLGALVRISMEARRSSGRAR